MVLNPAKNSDVNIASENNKPGEERSRTSSLGAAVRAVSLPRLAIRFVARRHVQIAFDAFLR